MKGVRNEAVNRLWQDNVPKFYKVLLEELLETLKIDDLLQNPLSKRTQKELSD